MHREWWLTREAGTAAFAAFAVVGLHAAFNDRPELALLSGLGLASYRLWGGDLREK
jgi:hypothetical protein